MAFPVVVKITYSGSKRYARELHKLGMYRTGSWEYRGNLTEREIEKLSFMQKRGVLTYRIDNEFGNRGGSYRNIFFRSSRPFVGDIYFCAYCGRPVRKKNLTVDHIVPVGRVKKSATLQKRLKRRGITSVNDIRNLAPSCMACNHKKSDRMGLWVIRGRIGKNQYIWMVRHVIRLSIVISIGIVFYNGTLTLNGLRNMLVTLSDALLRMAAYYIK